MECIFGREHEVSIDDLFLNQVQLDHPDYISLLDNLANNTIKGIPVSKYDFYANIHNNRERTNQIRKLHLHSGIGKKECGKINFQTSCALRAACLILKSKNMDTRPFIKTWLSLLKTDNDPTNINGISQNNLFRQYNIPLQTLFSSNGFLSKCIDFNFNNFKNIMNNLFTSNADSRFVDLNTGHLMLSTFNTKVNASGEEQFAIGHSCSIINYSGHLSSSDILLTTKNVNTMLVLMFRRIFFMMSGGLGAPIKISSITYFP